MSFYLLWHDRSHYEEECRWFREQIISVVRNSPAIKAAQPTLTGSPALPMPASAFAAV
jgi:hypothetical protein